MTFSLARWALSRAASSACWRPACSRAAESRRDGVERLTARPQERGQLALGNREGETGIAFLAAGDRRIDSHHPTAAVEQWPARIAARDAGGV
jgi:hypothetical protein